MEKLITKSFSKWATKPYIPHDALAKAAREIERIAIENGDFIEVVK